MADVNISMMLSDSGNSIQKRTGETKELNGELTKTQKLARSVAMGGGGAVSSQQVIDYNRGRATGGTGAEARDFAKQSEGLGGVVRLYATVAANIYAVTAAFSALSKAADTTNMITGLDKLSVSSGQALGTLSKRLYDATDGAISMRDALEATTKGSAAGLSSQQILRIGDAAKKASTALGISMPDAISRLSRGISKIEPELLDELGIYVKIDKANQDYARTLGKTVSSLTDFEKRQGFANAVLAEAEQKFGNIKVDVNPYSKLSATISNVAQSGLSLVNTVLTPLIKLLSESPTALSSLLVAIGASLVKQAIPALTSWRQELVKNADIAAATAKRLRDSYEEFDIGKKMRAGLQDAKEAADAANQALAGTQTALGQVLSPKSKILGRVMGEEYDAQAAVANQKAIETQLVKEQNALIKLKTLRDNINVSEVEHLKIMDQDIAKQEVRLGQMKQAALLNQVYIQEENKRIAALSGAETAGAKNTLEGRAKDIVARRAEMAAASTKILSNVGENTQIMGAKEAWKRLVDEVKNGPGVFNEFNERTATTGKTLTGFTRITTLASGGIRILSSTLMLAFNAMQPWLLAIGIATAAFSALNSAMSDNQKESENFEKSLDATKDAGKLANEVFFEMSKMDPFKLMSSQNIVAVANALEEVSNSLTKLVVDLDKVRFASNGWDRFVNSIMSVFGKSTEQQFSKQFAYSLGNAIKLMPEGTVKSEFVQKVKQILNIKEIDSKSLASGLLNIPDNLLVDITKQITVLESETTKKFKKISTSSTSLKDSFEKLGKAYDDLITSMAPTDPLSKLALGFITTSISMAEAFKTPKLALIELGNIIDDVGKMRFFSPEVQKGLESYRAQLTGLTLAAGYYENQLKKAEQTTQELKNQGAAAPQAVGEAFGYDVRLTTVKTTNPEAAIKALEKAQAVQKEAAETLQKFNAALKETIKPITDLALSDLAKKAITLLYRPLSEAAQLASLSISRANLAGGTGPGTATIEAELKRRELDIQLDNIKVTQSLVDAMLLANNLNDQQNNLRRLELANRDILRYTERQMAGENVKSELDTAQVERESIIAATAGLKAAQSYIQGTLTFKKLMETAPEQAKAFTAAEQARVESRRKTTQIKGEKAAVTVTEGYQKKAEQQAVLQKELQQNIELKSIELDRLKILTSNVEVVDKTLLNLRQQAETALEIQNIEKTMNDAQFRVNTDQKKYNEETDKVLKQSALERLQNTRKEYFQTAEILLARQEMSQLARQAETIRNTAAIAQRELDFANTRAKIEEDISSAIVSGKKTELDYLVSIGAITAQQAQDKQKALDLETQSMAYQRDLREAQLDKETKLASIRREAQIKAQAADTVEALIAVREQQKQDEGRVNTAYEDRIRLTQSLNAQRLKEIDLINELDIRQKGYAEVFRSSFDKMADAIVEFAQTGKLNFKSLINSMLADLLRLELRMQMQEMYQAFRPGLMNLVGSMFGGSGIGLGGPGGGTASLSGSQFALLKSAKGNAFDNGVHKFAMGGTFTNSIVDSPTLFKFAKGTGMMGEAGPEAIMPLKRDGQGNLGVRGGGGSVEVVVNNYSTERAEARETTDSRGNRRVEVVVGDMTAGEITRGGSSANRSIRGTFGLQPQLIRR